MTGLECSAKVYLGEVKVVVNPSICLFAFLCAILFISCEYNSEQELYPDSFCDDSRIATYSLGVQSVLSTHCYSCHSGSEPSAGFVIDTYETISPFVESGALLCSIEHGDDCLPMPDESPKILDCDIDLIRTWIDSGANDD